MTEPTWQGFGEWLSRARRKIHPADLFWLTPPGVLSIMAGFSLERLGERGVNAPRPAPSLAAHDPEFMELCCDLFRYLGRRYFRLELKGLEHLPPEGPAMLVGNHNGGPLPIDSAFTLLAVHDHLGPQRIVHSLGHDGLFHHPTLRRYVGRLGILPAGHKSGALALSAGRLVLLYPGSDWDAMRPFSDRNKVVLHGRKGFVRLALRTGAPIIPVISVGTHEQFVILTRGEKLARRLGLHRLMRLDSVPIAMSVPWGVAPAFLPYLPLPAQTSIEFGPPIRFPGLGPKDENDEAALAHCYQVVESAMQGILDRLSAGRVPFLGKLG